MPAPWEKYAKPTPWEKYSKPTSPGTLDDQLPGADYIPTLGQPTKADDSIAPYVANKALQGLASVPGLVPLAADTATWGLRRALAGKHPETMRNLPMTEDYNALAKKLLGYRDDMPEPTDEWGGEKLSAQMLGNMAEMAGGSVFPSGAVVGAAKRPLIALGKELTGVALSGEGATMGEHIAPPGYEAAGGLVGSMSGPLAAMKLIDLGMKGGSYGASKLKAATGVTGFTDAARRAEATQRAAEVIGPPLRAPQALTELERTSRVSREIPGFGEHLTLGRMTNSPSIKATEKGISGSDEALFNLAHEREKGLGAAVQHFEDIRFPPPIDSDPLTGVKRVYAEKLDKLDKHLSGLENRQRELANRFQRGDSEAAGKQALDVRAELANTAKAAAKERYAQVYAAADKVGLRISMDGIRDAAAAVNRDAGNIFQDKPGVIGKILKRYGPAPVEPKFKLLPNGKKVAIPGQKAAERPEVSLQEFHSLYKEAGREVAEARYAGRDNEARMIEQVRSQIKSYVDELEGAQYGEVGKLFKDANTFYKTKYADLFKSGVGAEMVARGPFGARSTNENAKIFSSLVFKPRDPSGVREYLEMMGDDPRAKEALENGVMDIFVRDHVKGSQITPAQIAEFKRKYKEPLELLPELSKTFDSVDTATRLLTAQREHALAMKKDFASSTLAKLAGHENPETAVGLAMKSPKAMRALVGSATTPDERAAVVRGIVSHVMEKGDPAEFFAKNHKVLESALGKEHLGSLNTLLEARTIADRVKAPTELSYTKLGDPLTEKFGTTIPQVLSEHRSVSQHYAAPVTAISRMGMRWWNALRNNQRDALVAEAIYNPDTAEALASHLKNFDAQTAKKLDPHLIPYGIRALGKAYTIVPPQQQDQRNEQAPPDH